MVSRLSPIYSSIYWRGHRAFAYKTKFRTGLSHSRSVLATLFGLTEIQVSPFVASARKAFLQDLVPFYIGFPNILHSQIIEKSTDTTKELFSDWIAEDTAILVMDCTFIYREK